MPLVPEHDDFDSWVAALADPVRSQRAYWHLVLSGERALGAVRSGLHSPNDEVRRLCTKALDLLVDEQSFADLIGMLDDENPKVRVEALHALACDRCKDNACRPDPLSVLDRAIELIQNDPDRHVRSYACELVGRWVHEYERAAVALSTVSVTDPAPSVRKKAGWYAPGGSIFRRTQPAVRQ